MLLHFKLCCHLCVESYACTPGVSMLRHGEGRFCAFSNFRQLDLVAGTCSAEMSYAAKMTWDHVT